MTQIQITYSKSSVVLGNKDLTLTHLSILVTGKRRQHYSSEVFTTQMKTPPKTLQLSCSSYFRPKGFWSEAVSYFLSHSSWAKTLWEYCSWSEDKEALSVLMLCAPVFIFTSGSSALLGRPRCGLSIWLSLLVIFNTAFWIYAFLFHEKTGKTREYSKSAIFVWYKNGRRWLLGAQSINSECFFSVGQFYCHLNT